VYSRGQMNLKYLPLRVRMFGPDKRWTLHVFDELIRCETIMFRRERQTHGLGNMECFSGIPYVFLHTLYQKLHCEELPMRGTLFTI